MFVYQIPADSTDVSVVIRIIDSVAGTPETGVVFNTTGIDLEYRREGAASTDITEATLAALTTAHTDGGFLHIGNGYYRLDLPDAACATGVAGVLVHGTVTDMVVIGCYIQLSARVNANLTHIAGTSVSTSSAQLGVNVVNVGGSAVSATSGLLNANVTQISGDSTAADNCEAFFDGNGYAGGTTPLDVNVIQWRGTQPNVLTSNRVDVSVGAMASGTLTATAIAADAFTAAKFASDVGTEFATAVGALVVESEGSYTVKQVLSVTLAALAGETTGTTFLTPNGNATRIDATVASNERTAVTLTPSS